MTRRGLLAGIAAALTAVATGVIFWRKPAREPRLRTYIDLFHLQEYAKQHARARALEVPPTVFAAYVMTCIAERIIVNTVRWHDERAAVTFGPFVLVEDARVNASPFQHMLIEEWT